MSKSLSEILSEIKQRADEATSGKWRWSKKHPFALLPAKTIFWRNGVKTADLEFIAHSKQDIPKLLKALEFAAKQLTAYEQMIKISELSKDGILTHDVYPAVNILAKLLGDGAEDEK